jgi:recombination protein RecR
MATSFPKAIKNVIEAFERLPGVGPKTATRLAFYVLNMPSFAVNNFADSLKKIKEEIKFCNQCFGVSEDDTCDICLDTKRNKKIVCVVARAIDMMAIENMGDFNGVYHVLGGVINPLEHIGPDDIKIYELLERIKNDEISELIIATNPTMEGEATALYIKKKVEDIKEGIKISRIGSGLPMGADLEFADQATLSRAMNGRREL